MDNLNIAVELESEIPKITSFLSFTTVYLSEVTGTAPALWSRYFAGTRLGEGALDKYSKMLGMESHSLFLAIKLRRKVGKVKKPKLVVTSKYK